MYCLSHGQYWLTNIFIGLPLLIDGFVVHNATTVLIIIMTFLNGLKVEDSDIRVDGSNWNENVFASTFSCTCGSAWLLHMVACGQSLKFKTFNFLGHFAEARRADVFFLAYYSQACEYVLMLLKKECTLLRSARLTFLL